jgi:hypothetical protein
MAGDVALSLCACVAVVMLYACITAVHQITGSLCAMACGCGSDRQPMAVLDSACAPASGVLVLVYGNIHPFRQNASRTTRRSMCSRTWQPHIWSVILVAGQPWHVPSQVWCQRRKCVRTQRYMLPVQVSWVYRMLPAACAKLQGPMAGVGGSCPMDAQQGLRNQPRCPATACVGL